MATTLKIYTDLDSLFDTRRGIITKVARESNPKFVWYDFEEIYKNRRLDYYNRPSIGITPEKYEEYYTKRTVDDWANENECFFYPSNLLSNMLQIVRGIEFGSTQTIQLSSFQININVYPFVLSSELTEELRSHIVNSFKLPVSVIIASVPYENQTAPFLNGFDYVFRYGHLFRPEFKVWFETAKDIIRPGTKYIVPDILAKEFGDEDAVSFLKDIPISEHIKRSSSIFLGRLIFIPEDKSLYDYAKTE